MSVFEWIDSITAGTWPEWMAAIATSVAVLVAAYTYCRDQADRRVSQARKVYALHTVARQEFGEYVDTGYGWAELGVLHSTLEEDKGHCLKTNGVHVRVTVHNVSDEVISNIEVLVNTDSVEGFPQGKHDDLRSARYVLGAIPPGETHDVDFVAIDHWSTGLSEPPIECSVCLTFTDSAGHHWRRTDARPVKELKRNLLQILTRKQAPGVDRRPMTPPDLYIIKTRDWIRGVDVPQGFERPQ